MTADIAANSVTGGPVMTDQSTVTGGNVATWADGIATLPDTSRAQTIFGTSNGVNLLSSDSLALNFNDGANQNVDVSSIAPNVWNSVVVIEDDTGLRLVHNGGAIRAVNWVDYSATPAASNVSIFGRNNNAFSGRGGSSKLRRCKTWGNLRQVLGDTYSYSEGGRGSMKAAEAGSANKIRTFTGIESDPARRTGVFQ